MDHVNFYHLKKGQQVKVAYNFSKQDGLLYKVKDQKIQTEIEARNLASKIEGDPAVVLFVTNFDHVIEVTEGPGKGSRWHVKPEDIITMSAKNKDKSSLGKQSWLFEVDFESWTQLKKGHAVYLCEGFYNRLDIHSRFESLGRPSSKELSVKALAQSASGSRCKVIEVQLKGAYRHVVVEVEGGVGAASRWRVERKDILMTDYEKKKINEMKSYYATPTEQEFKDLKAGDEVKLANNFASLVKEEVKSDASKVQGALCKVKSLVYEPDQNNSGKMRLKINLEVEGRKDLDDSARRWVVFKHNAIQISKKAYVSPKTTTTTTKPATATASRHWTTQKPSVTTKPATTTKPVTTTTTTNYSKPAKASPYPDSSFFEKPSSCAKPADIPIVYIDYKAYQLLSLWARLGGKKNREFTAFGRLQTLKGSLVVTEAYLIKHSGSSASVEMDEKDHIKVMLELDKRGVPPDEAFGCWVHSHPGTGPGATYLSGVDEGNIETLLANSQLLVSIVFDSEGGHPYTRIDLKHPRLRLPTKLKIVNLFMEEELSDAEKLFDEKSSSKSYSVSVSSKGSSSGQSKIKYYDDDSWPDHGYGGYGRSPYEGYDTSYYRKSTLDHEVFSHGTSSQKGSSTTTPSQLQKEKLEKDSQKEERTAEEMLQICKLLKLLDSGTKTKDHTKAALLSLGLESEEVEQWLSPFDTLNGSTYSYQSPNFRSQERKDFMEKVDEFIKMVEGKSLVSEDKKVVGFESSSEKTDKIITLKSLQDEDEDDDDEDCFTMYDLADGEELSEEEKEDIENRNKHVQNVLFRVQMGHMSSEDALSRMKELGVSEEKSEELLDEAKNE